MLPTTFPKDMLPKDIPHKLVVIGPPPSYDIRDDDAPSPIESLIMEDGFHVRIAVDPQDVQELLERPYIHIVFQSPQVPVFWIGTELTALRGGR